MSDIYEGFEASALRGIIASLEAEVTRLETQADALFKMNSAKSERIEKAHDLIKPLLEDETIDPTSQLGLDICEALAIELTEDVSVTFTVVYSAYVSVPKGTDVSDLEIDLSWHPDVTLYAETVGSACQDSIEAEAF